MHLDRLTQLLERADHHYYNLDDPIMTDAEYNHLVRKYQELAKEVWVRVGTPSVELKEVKHKRLMPTQDKVHSVGELCDALSHEDEMVLMPKVDGLGLDLEYVYGHLFRGLTRGDHFVGEDVTDAVRLIPDIPNVLPQAYRGMPSFHVRGEGYLTDAGYAVVGGTNKRNAVAGLVRRKSNRAQTHHASFVAYEGFDGTLGHHDDFSFSTKREELGFVQALGFKVVPSRTAIANQLSPVDLETLASKPMPFETDGVVVMFNDLAKCRSLGYATKSPRFSVAYKFDDEFAETALKEVRWSATRTGRVVPVASFDPVQLEGTTVVQATLHNRKYVEMLGGLAVDDTIAVFKSNQIIPQVERVVERSEHPQLPFPVACPCCGVTLTRNDVDLLCPNLGCDEKLIQGLIYMCSRKNLDVDGMGRELADSLVLTGRVQRLSDFFMLDEKDLARTPYGKSSYGAVRSRKLLNEVEKAKQKPWSVVLHSLGCPGLGEPECESITAVYSLHHLLGFTQDPNGGVILGNALEDMRGIGVTTATAFVEWLFGNVGWLQVIADCAGLQTTPTAPEALLSTVLAGQTWVITGTLAKPRSFYEDLVKKHGGATSGSVSKKTHGLLAGANVGASKFEAAKKHGISVYDEAGFFALIGG